jgi:glycosyltransferase involved in cell wall biosynthesis
MRESQVKISVLVPFYQNINHINSCIDAILTQQYPVEHFEVIMVDNNSSDGSTEIVRQFPQIKLVSEKKQGSYCARNKGLQVAKGSIIAFTDADCSPNDRWLSSIDRAMRNPDTAIVLGKRLYASNSSYLDILGAYENERIKQICARNDRFTYYGYTNNMAVRRTFFDYCGHFLEIPRGADSLFVRKIVDRFGCGGVCFDDEVCIRHLEINTMSDYYRKRIIYGKSYERYRKILNSRTFGNRERFQILRNITKNQSYATTKYLLLAVSLLFVGMMHFELGRQLEVINRARKMLR